MNVNNAYAEIILPVPVAELYTYSIPNDFEAKDLIGKRVIVQFGTKKFYTGIVKSIHSEKPEYETKEIISVLDDKRIISDIQFDLWNWIAAYYMCSLGEIYKAALPSGLKLESETNIILNKDADYTTITEKEEMIIGLLTNQNSVSVKQLEKELEYNVLPSLKKLIDKNIITAEEWVKKRYKPKYEYYISLPEKLKDEDYFTEVSAKLKAAKKQNDLLQNFIYLTKFGSDRDKGLKPADEFSKANLLKHTGATSAHLKGLIEKGYLKQRKKEVSRLAQIEHEISDDKVLNKYQKKALSEINKEFANKNTVLLHGVTSSGKTEIYIELIKEKLKEGKQVLYLLPEIALTAQITSRLAMIFGDKIGIYHSKFNDNERVEVWKNLEKKKYKIILGVRSSIFLPFENLGLIIVDEEHENTYKQYNPAPRYNARDSSIILAQMHNAKVLLGTATPSIESYFNAKSGKYALVELFQRFKDISLPEIQISDIKEAKRKKQMRSLFAPVLTDAIKQALENKEQIILFQNRRGFSPYTICESCGHIPKCENCDVSLTYHKYTNQLMCHYCGYSEKANSTCKQCKKPTLKTGGFGTQKIEDEIKNLFPEVKTARMDTDSTSNKNAFQRIIFEFETGKTNILIGTQMVSKGLDFENVGLVGIMNADNLLNFPDFRAFERSYQLMAQVSGRAGRKNKQGKVIIQTAEKNHPIIKNVLENDYLSMFLNQLELRKQFKYPPFFRLINLNIKHKKKHIVDEAAELLAKELKTVLGSRVLGPEYPIISWIKTWYIKSILIKIEKDIPHKQVKASINEIISKIRLNDPFKSVQIIADADPM